MTNNDHEINECYCGGEEYGHVTGDGGCFREYMTMESVPIPVDGNENYLWKWSHNNMPVNDFTLSKYNIVQHGDGRWSCPKG